MTPDAPAKLLKISGDQQTGPAGQALTTAVDVQVQDQYGNGVPGVPTQWAPSAGGSVVLGQPDGVTAGTSGPGRGGIAGATWTLGSTVGSQTLTVTAGTLSVTFTATATQPPGTLATLMPAGGNAISAPVGSAVTLAVKATDAGGGAVPGVTIQWTATTTGSSITATSTTDATGIAKATATLATATGTNTFKATAPSSPSVAPASFTITGTPGRACRLVFSNLPQTADRGDPLPLNVQVAVYDSLNNPVPNFPLTIFFRIPANSFDVRGTVSPLQTDNTGLASTGGAVILGSEIGGQEIDQNQVRPCGWGSAPFVGMGVGIANALATPVATLENATAATSAAAGSTILLKVRAKDRHGFYVPNASLTARITSGDGTFGGGGTTATTNTAGTTSSAEPGSALLSYTVGSAATQQITVTSADGPSVVITIHAIQ